TAAGRPVRVWPAGIIRRVVPARHAGRVRRAAWASWAGHRVLWADVRSSDVGADRRDLATRTIGRLVSACGGVARMTLVDTTYWQEATRCLAAGEATLLSLWGEPGRVHMAVQDETVVVLSLDCPDGNYPSVGAQHAPAIRLERAARDLFG